MARILTLLLVARPAAGGTIPLPTMIAMAECGTFECFSASAKRDGQCFDKKITRPDGDIFVFGACDAAGKPVATTDVLRFALMKNGDVNASITTPSEAYSVAALDGLHRQLFAVVRDADQRKHPKRVWYASPHYPNLRIMVEELAAGADPVASPRRWHTGLVWRPPLAGAPYRAVMRAIAADIEAIKADYPQLAEFSAARNARPDMLQIGYGFHTHAPPRTGGWTSGVPHPDDDGVWFSLDFHDPRSTLEMHTQSMDYETQCFGDMKVGFLFLEGKGRSILAPIWRILRRHGVVECPKASR